MLQLKTHIPWPSGPLCVRMDAGTRLDFSQVKDFKSKLKEAFDMVCHFFSVKELLPDQVTALTAFFSGKDLYFSAPTGYGKSLVSQCLPMIVDIFKEQAIGTSTALVIEPLTSLMIDQVNKINKTGTSAAAIYEGQDEEILKGVENGDYSLVYSLPESMLSSDRWRKLLSSSDFSKQFEILVIDEAHCIVHW